MAKLVRYGPADGGCGTCECELGSGDVGTDGAEGLEVTRVRWGTSGSSVDAPFPFTFGERPCPFTPFATNPPPPFIRFSLSPPYGAGGFPIVGTGGELLGKTRTFSSSSLLDLRRWIWTAVDPELLAIDIAQGYSQTMRIRRG